MSRVQNEYAIISYSILETKVDVKKKIDFISTELLTQNFYTQGGIDTMHKVLVWLKKFPHQP